MKRKGCKPKGPALVEHLDGSLQAKERLEVILETLAGRIDDRPSLPAFGSERGALPSTADGSACSEPRPS